MSEDKEVADLGSALTEMFKIDEEKEMEERIANEDAGGPSVGRSGPGPVSFFRHESECAIESSSNSESDEAPEYHSQPSYGPAAEHSQEESAAGHSVEHVQEEPHLFPRARVLIPMPRTQGWDCEPLGNPYTDYDGPVTVGVEWEFLVDPETGPYGNMRKLPTGSIIAPGHVGANAAWRPHVYHIAKKMRELGVLVMTRPESHFASINEEFCMANYPYANHEAEGVGKFLNYYHVGVDTSIRDDVHHEDLDDQWLPVKISTPAVTIQGLDDVQRLFENLHTFFRIKVNYTCGVHVHVGNGDHGFPVHWVRTAAALCWAISPIMDLFHPLDRGPGCEYSHSIRYFSAMAQDDKTTSRFDKLFDHLSELDVSNVPFPPGSSRFDRSRFSDRRLGPGYGCGPQPHVPRHLPRIIPAPVEVIEHILTRDYLTWDCITEPKMAWRGVARLLACKSLEDVLVTLRSTLIGSERMSYNFNNLRHQGKTSYTRPRTIEFRQHGGTTNVAEIAAWARVCARLILACRPDSSNLDNIHDNHHAKQIATKAVYGGLAVTPYDAYQLMVSIGAYDDAFSYYNNGPWHSLGPVVHPDMHTAHRYIMHRL